MESPGDDWASPPGNGLPEYSPLEGQAGQFKIESGQLGRSE
jgi:hypothetical protein